jgi:hypothetical protein
MTNERFVTLQKSLSSPAGAHDVSGFVILSSLDIRHFLDFSLANSARLKRSELPLKFPSFCPQFGRWVFILGAKRGRIRRGNLPGTFLFRWACWSVM